MRKATETGASRVGQRRVTPMRAGRQRRNFIAGTVSRRSEPSTLAPALPGMLAVRPGECGIADASAEAANHSHLLLRPCRGRASLGAVKEGFHVPVAQSDSRSHRFRRRRADPGAVAREGAGHAGGENEARIPGRRHCEKLIPKLPAKLLTRAWVVSVIGAGRQRLWAP